MTRSQDPEPPFLSCPFPEHVWRQLEAELDERDRGAHPQTSDDSFERRLQLARKWRDGRERHKAWLLRELERRTDEDWERILYDEPAQRAAAELARAQAPVREALAAVEQKLQRATAGRPRSCDNAAARSAYLAARAGGAKVEAAIAAAMEAGGFKSKSRVFELKRTERWDRPKAVR